MYEEENFRTENEIMATVIIKITEIESRIKEIVGCEGEGEKI